MPDYTDRIIGPQHVLAALTTVYTTAAGYRAHIHKLTVINNTAAAVGFTLSIGVDQPDHRLFDITRSTRPAAGSRRTRSVSTRASFSP